MPKSGKTWVKDLSLAASALGALSLVPARADAAVVKGLGPALQFPGKNSTTAVPWDIDGTGGEDFQLVFGTRGSAPGPYIYSGQIQRINTSNALLGNGIGKNVARLNANDVIGPSPSPNSWIYANIFAASLNPPPFNNPAPGDDFADFSDSSLNYFGFLFISGGNTYYGYAIIDYSTSPTATITEWYWNNTPNGTILAGQGADPVSSVPGPIGLAGLAAGAAWTRKLRRRIRESAEVA